MGVTLHAIVEVQIEGKVGLTRWPRYWEGVSVWELNKDYVLSIALDDVTLKGWPRTYLREVGNKPLDWYHDSEVSSERREVEQADIASNYRWATLSHLRELVLPDDAFRARFDAIVAGCEALARYYGGAERVRVLFYSIT